MRNSQTLTTLKDVQFPILYIKGATIGVIQREDTLTLCTAKALKDGWYQGLTIIDSFGKKFRVIEARKLHGVGLFGGYILFLNRKLRVELRLTREPEECSLGEVKELLLKSLQHDDRWIAGGNWEELQSNVKDGQSIREIFLSFGE